MHGLPLGPLMAQVEGAHCLHGCGGGWGAAEGAFGRGAQRRAGPRGVGRQLPRRRQWVLQAFEREAPETFSAAQAGSIGVPTRWGRFRERTQPATEGEASPPNQNTAAAHRLSTRKSYANAVGVNAQAKQTSSAAALARRRKTMWGS